MPNPTPPIPSLDTDTGTGAYVPAIAYPSWMDPQYVIETTELDLSTVALAAGVGVMAVGGNARRWGIGFIAPATNTQSVRLAPDSLVATYPFLALPASGSLWLSLAQYGVMVTWEWYAICSASAQLRVYQNQLH